MKLQALGIDLAKNVFHLVGLDSSGQVVIRKRCSRTQVLAFTANVQAEVIGMEACSGAHFLGRALREQGHEVRLMPAQYVKPTSNSTACPGFASFLNRLFFRWSITELLAGRITGLEASAVADCAPPSAEPGKNETITRATAVRSSGDFGSAMVVLVQAAYIGAFSW